MWGFGSKAITVSSRPRIDSARPSQASSDCSDDEISVNNSREEGLECAICSESFNIVDVCLGHVMVGDNSI
uniref:Zinc finger, RING/FYVE/PHD-type n=1 Tax=Helianthus annuus TaxID=4232 RepID=A0A251TND0_HELAN